MNEQKIKQLLKEARNKIIEAQVIVRPTDERWGELDGAVGILEKIIMQIKDEQQGRNDGGGNLGGLQGSTA